MDQRISRHRIVRHARAVLTVVLAFALALPLALGAGAIPAAAAGEGLGITATVVSDAPSDIGISNVPGVDGEPFGYQLAYACSTFDPAGCADVVIRDTLPGELELVGELPEGWSLSGQTLQISLGTIPAGSGTLLIPVRFRTDPTLAADDRITVRDTASITGVIADHEVVAASSPVTATGRVKPVGGAHLSKTITPATLSEFSRDELRITLEAGNAGTIEADQLQLVDLDPDFFDAFDITAIDAPTAPPGSGTITVEITSDGDHWESITTPAVPPTPVIGVRASFAEVPAGAAGSLRLTAALRDTLRSSGAQLVAADSADYVNHATVSVAYPDAALDRTAATDATVKVRGEVVTAPVVSKGFAPESVASSYAGRILTTIQAHGGGQGGARSVTIADPAPTDGVSPFGRSLHLDGGFTVVWPDGARTAKLTLSDGTTAVITRPTTAFAVPIVDPAAITGFTVSFDAGSDAPIRSDFTASVTAGAVLAPDVADGSYGNNAEVAVVSATGNSSGESVTPVVRLPVQTPHAEISTTKSFTRPQVVLGSPTQADVIQLRTVYGPASSGTNTEAGTVVIQDPAVLPAVGVADFFDEYDIVGVRAVDCGPGDRVRVEIYDGTAWVAVREDGCAAAPLEIVDPDAQGIRFSYTNADGIAPGRAFQPEVVIRARLQDRETGADVLDLSPVPAGQPARMHVSPPNCATASVTLPGADAPADIDTVADPCPSIQSLLPHRDGDGVGLAKTLIGADGTDAAREGSRAAIRAMLVLSQRPAVATQRLAFQDPRPDDEYARVFAAVTDLTSVGPFTVPRYEQARVDWLDADGRVLASSPTVRGGRTLRVDGAPSYAGFRLVLEEDPTDPGIEPGIESASYDTLGSIPVSYRLRDDFRTAIAGHAPGEPVRNNTCYTQGSAALAEGPDGSPLDPDACQLAQAPFDEAGFNGPGNVNDGGWILNNAEVVATYLTPDADGRSSSRGVTTGSRSQVFRITNSVANAELVKAVLPEASMPLPLTGEAPGEAQERTIQLQARNTSGSAVTELRIVDADPGFWASFELVSLAGVSIPSGATVRYDLGFTDGRAPVTALPDLRGVSGLDEVNAVTAHVTGWLASSASATIAFVVRLRATVTEPTRVDNAASVVALSPFAVSEPSGASASLDIREPGSRVSTSKAITLADGSSPFLDERPALIVDVQTTNTGELALTSIVTEDDDVLDPGDYPSGTPLPANVDHDFWDSTDFERITAIRVPAGADTVLIERFTGTEWAEVARLDADAVDVAAVNAALSGVPVEGLRASFTSTTGATIVAGERGGIEFLVEVAEHAVAGTPLRNCAESAYRISGALAWLDPSCASFTPRLGTPQVAITKVFAASGQPTAIVAAGTTQRYAITVTNTGTQALGSHGTPFEVRDLLPPTLAYRAGTAQPRITLPSDETDRSSLRTLPTAVVSGSTVSWTWPLGEALAPGESVTIQLSLEVAAALPPGSTVTNTAAVPQHGGTVACAAGVAHHDDSCTAAAVLTVNAAGSIRATKTIRGEAATGATGSDPDCDGDSGFVGNPCVALTPLGSDYTWRLDLENAGNSTMRDLVLIDLLPAAGDTGAYLDAPRGSEWRGVPITAPRVISALPAGVRVAFAYLPADAATEPCLREVRDSGVTACDAWQPLPAGALIPADALALRVAADYGIDGKPAFEVGARLTITWDETVPASAQSSLDRADPVGRSVPDGRLIQWNSFGFRAVDAGSGETFRNESTKAGALFTGAAIVITKEVRGPAPQAARYGFAIDCSDADGTPIDLLARGGFDAERDGRAAFTLRAGQSRTVDGLPLGSSCLVEETRSLGASATRYVVDDGDAAAAPDGLRIELIAAPGGHVVRAVQVLNLFASPTVLAGTGVDVLLAGLIVAGLLLGGLGLLLAHRQLKLRPRRRTSWRPL